MVEILAGNVAAVLIDSFARMASTSSNSLWYVYGVVAADFSATSMPDGLDDAAVFVETSEKNDVAALVSRLDQPDYQPAMLEERSGSVEWLSPRAMAHDRVLTWASDRGAVVPLPMFSLFSGRQAVQTMLGDRGEQLSATLARIGDAREYALRVYRVDAELLAAVHTLSPKLQEMAATATNASPGQRYLLERKLDGEKRSEMRAVSQRLVDEIVSALRSCAQAVQRSPIPRVAEADAARGTMVLNAAFLVRPDALPNFQRTLTTIVDERGAQGFRFDFTGPWPAYHFVAAPADGN
jgi:gas vesicle protein GvpL/GvpF